MTPDPDKPRPDKPDPAQLAQRARALYLDASRQLDPATAGRLRAARRLALDAARPSPARFAPRLLLPAGAFAVLALATLAIWQPLHHGDQAPPPAVAAGSTADTEADLPPDADSADPQLYQNLDFYGWLAANDRVKVRR